MLRVVCEGLIIMAKEEKMIDVKCSVCMKDMQMPESFLKAGKIDRKAGWILVPYLLWVEFHIEVGHL